MQTNENTEFAGYQVPKGEENMYHCVIEQKQFDASTGQIESSRGAKIWEEIF